MDDIDALAIKAAAKHLADPIRHVVNTSLMTSKYASRWKISKLLPLLKSPELNKLTPGSFRPIAILPTLSKLVEKAAHAQLLQYLEKSNMISTAAHAYRSGYSTSTAMLELTEELYRGVDENKVSILMTLDQSSAFDCVQHKLLLDKLEYYDLDKTAIQWISNYLEHRSQFVAIGTAKSNIYPMRRGVPQGSVLGPLLFSIFTNELCTVIHNPECRNPEHQNTENLFGPNCEECGKIFQYADDTTFHLANKHRSTRTRKQSQKTYSN